MSLSIPVSEIVEQNNNPLLGKHTSWGRILLGDIATIQNGCALASSQFSKDGDMPLIRIRDVGKEETDTKYSGEYDEAYVVKPGDLLVGMDGDFNCARWRGPRGLLNQRVCRIKLTSDVYHPKLLDYVLPGYLKAINDNTSSVTVKHLSSKSIAEIPLPLPPTDQQQLIVAEIEKQFSRLDEAVAGLKRVKGNLKRYKASVLKAAVEGKLTEQWRKAHPDVETGAALLKRILAEQKKKWEEKNPGKKYKEPVAPDTSNLPRLPEGWVWATPEMLAQYEDNAICAGPFGTIFKAKDFRPEGIPIIFLRHISPGKYLTHKPGFMDKNKWIDLFQPYSVYGGELLITKLREPPGISAIYPFNIGPAMVTPDVMKMSVNNRIAEPRFLMYYFNSQVSLRTAAELAFGTTRLRLTLPIFRQLPVPVPPLVEQRIIVDEVERRLSVAEEIDAVIDTNLKRAERLRQAVLCNAFKGKLLLEVQKNLFRGE